MAKNNEDIDSQANASRYCSSIIRGSILSKFYIIFAFNIFKIEFMMYRNYAQSLKSHFKS